jgi:hypothetical protein
MRQERDINRDWALRLAEVGIAVFPCGPDKKPLIKWRDFSSSDTDAVAIWWTQFPNALPGIDLEKCELLVLDGDRHGGPDGRAALRSLLAAQPDYDASATPRAITPGDGAHVYFNQNGHELTNSRGDLPEGIDVRGCGGYTIAPYAVLPDGRRYRAIRDTPDLIAAYEAGTIPAVPQGIVALLEARKTNGKPDIPSESTKPGIREKAYALAALEGCTQELADAKPGSRNELLNALAYRLGRMIARGWLHREHVEANLSGAMCLNGYVKDKGLKAVEATLRSGLDAGMKEPHPDLADDEAVEDDVESVDTAPPDCPPCSLEQTHQTFRRWLGDDYDIATLDAVLAVTASERLPGDPAWLLIISGSGNAKTETVQATGKLGTIVVSTITSDAALLSGVPRRSRTKDATGGLLRQIGKRGILAVKDVTSILSMNRDARASILAALREIHDGQWVRNVGSDGGRTLTWTGRIVVIGACTTKWDQAHGVIAAMGDRFVLVRSDSRKGRIAAGLRAMRNTGNEIRMREELAAAVAGVITSVDSNGDYALTEQELNDIVRAADLVTLARTGVETDYRGDIIDAHAPEVPTRFAKQLEQIMRGALAIGMSRNSALRLAIRCAGDSMPQLRLAILRDVAANPDTRVLDVRRRLQKPRTTIDRALAALHILGLLTCREEEQDYGGKPQHVRHYSLVTDVDLNVLDATHIPPF